MEAIRHPWRRARAAPVPSMKFKSANYTSVVKSIAQSFTVDMIGKLGRMVFPSYDLHERLGYKPTVPIAPAVAARQLVADAERADVFLDLVERLFSIGRSGFMGRKYPVGRLQEIAAGITAEGYVFDPARGLFTEDSRVSRRHDWGRMKEGAEYAVALLRLDIAGNSELVRSNRASDIKAAYGKFRALASAAVEARDGRIWQWEGDGGLACFYHGQPFSAAAHAGMEIQNALLVYGMLENPLDRPLAVRAAAHGGPVAYSRDEAALMRNETIKEVIELEGGHTKPGALTVSSLVLGQLDRPAQELFRPVKGDGRRGLAEYRIRRAAP